MNYLQLIGRGAKNWSIVGCISGALLAWVFFAILILAQIQRGETVWLGVLLMGYVGFALSWFAIKLIRSPLPGQGGTMMPRWFLVSTVAFFVGITIVGWILDKLIG